MKVCMIAPIPPFRGGIAKYCHSLAQELEARHEQLLLSYLRQYPRLLYGSTPQQDPACSIAKVRNEFSRVSFEIDSVRPSTWLAALHRIYDFSPDIVIFPWWTTYWTPLYAWLMGRLRKRGISCLILCINVYEHEDSALKKLLTRFILRQADLLIAHSEQELLELRNINRGATIRKQLLPIFNYNYSLPTRSGGSTLHLLFFGFVRPYKGLDTLFHALTLVKELDVELKVVGEFWSDNKEYRSLIRDLDIYGRVEIDDRYVSEEEMVRYFAWSDVVVLPYRAAKTSGVIATAYGFGRPVLATDVGGFKEVVQDKCTGKLVRAGDPQAIADGIAWFYHNREIDFADNISKFVTQRMSWGSLVNTIEEMVTNGG